VDTYAGEAIDGYSINNAQAKKVAPPKKMMPHNPAFSHTNDPQRTFVVRCISAPAVKKDGNLRSVTQHLKLF
jgi:hypothetical protein